MVCWQAEFRLPILKELCRCEAHLFWPKQSPYNRGLLTALPKEHAALAYGASVGTMWRTARVSLGRVRTLLAMTRVVQRSYGDIFIDDSHTFMVLFAR